MFPDVSGLKAVIEFNTKTQEQLLGQLKLLLESIKGLTNEVSQLRFQLKNHTETNIAGPK